VLALRTDRALPAGPGAELAGILRRFRQAPGEALDGEAPPALARAVAIAASHGATLTWEVEPATADHDELAAGAGLVLGRELLELHRPLPLEPELAGVGSTVAVRAFVPGQDEEAWLAVNNRAFAWHPEQSGMTLDALLDKEAEPWFDPAGFLLHEADGADGPELAGFCWTKVHAALAPPEGEVFVIGVDPDHHGRGLGRGLVVAGFAHLAARGLATGVLWTEADNLAARRLYDDLGFTTRRRHCWYRSVPVA
jgi:mycothiol synthase